jgi:type 1 glutamine amidotransferase
MRSIAWTRTYGQSKVFCLVGGHDSQTWQNDLFRLVLARGIVWAAPSRR